MPAHRLSSVLCGEVKQPLEWGGRFQFSPQETWPAPFSLSAICCQSHQEEPLCPSLHLQHEDTQKVGLSKKLLGPVKDFHGFHVFRLKSKSDHYNKFYRILLTIFGRALDVATIHRALCEQQLGSQSPKTQNSPQSFEENKKVLLA